MNLPNSLTVSRIFMIVIFVIAFYLPFSWSNLLAALLFVVASVTDWLDGYLARKLNQMSSFGAFLDPVADKLLVMAALVLLTEHIHAWWFTLPAIIIIGREILVSALREWMAEIGERGSVAVSWIGKVKTTFQMIAIICLLLADAGGKFMFYIGIIFLYGAVILTIWSMFNYLNAAKHTLLNDA